MTSLLAKKCVPCEGGTEPLSEAEINTLKPEVPSWVVASDGTSISREFEFADFVAGIVFMTDVAHIAEEEGHHPDMLIHDYKKVLVTLSTHAIKGLSENDFILAAKIDDIHAHTDSE